MYSSCTGVGDVDHEIRRQLLFNTQTVFDVVREILLVRHSKTAGWRRFHASKSRNIRRRKKIGEKREDRFIKRRVETRVGIKISPELVTEDSRPGANHKRVGRTQRPHQSNAR